jgi:hypothetical protein
MKTITGILLLTLCSFNLQAQRNCGAEDYRRQLVASNPAIAVSIELAEQQIQKTLKNSRQNLQRDTFANEVINIPVVIHVIYKNAAQNISDAQIMSQLEALNKDFANQNADRVNTPNAFSGLAADTRIRFCLAQVDPTGKRTTGIIRKQTNVEVFIADDAMKNTLSGGDNAWDAAKYLNVWVCNLGSRSLGYASLPGGPADKDGIVIGFDVFGTVGNVRAPFNKGRTATHEVGHWLGLKHIWGDNNCGDDGVDDTPKQKSYNFGCPSFPHVTECSETADGDMFMNYMDFSDDACMNMFTIGQKKRMRALFASGNMRNSFLHSFACDSNLVQAAPLPADTVAAPVVVKTAAYKIYPNPVQSFVTVEYKPAADMLVQSFSVYNTVGVKVFEATLNSAKSSFNLSTLAAGMYIVCIGEGSSRFTTKIFKM